MSSLKAMLRRWISRVSGMLHSVLSWMPWSRLKRERRAHLREMEVARAATFQRLEFQQWAQLDLLPRLLQEQETLLRRELLRALTPAAEAMQRQDRLLLQESSQQKELLMEVLQGQQPPLQTVIFQELGLPTRQ